MSRTNPRVDTPRNAIDSRTSPDRPHDAFYNLFERDHYDSESGVGYTVAMIEELPQVLAKVGVLSKRSALSFAFEG